MSGSHLIVSFPLLQQMAENGIGCSGSKSSVRLDIKLFDLRFIQFDLLRGDFRSEPGGLASSNFSRLMLIPTTQACFNPYG